MSEVGRRARAAFPAVGLLVLATGAMLALAGALGFAPTPPPVQIALVLFAAALVGFAATDQVRAALTDWHGATAAESGVHRRRTRRVGVPPPPALRETAVANRAPLPREPLADTDHRELVETGIFTGRTRRMPTTDEMWGPPDDRPTGPSTTRPNGPSTTRPNGPSSARPNGPSTADEPVPPERPAIGRPSWLRLGIVTLAVAVLVVPLWVRPEPVSKPILAVLTFLFGYGAYALPLLPLMLVRPLPRLERAPWPWQIPLVPIVERRFWTREELALLALGTLTWLRERLLTRATGLVVATLGLLHLVRGSPRLLDGGTSRAGGLLGYLVGEPLRLAFATGGAIGLLVGVLACAAVVIAASVGRYFGTVTGYAALAVALLVPLGGAGTGHWYGFEYYLRIEHDHVVVVAGLSPTHRQAVHDTSLSVDGLSPSLRELFAKGLPVADNADGDRIARALARPGESAAGTFVGDQFELKTGDCFDWIGGSSQLRYVAPCNGAHIGEVTFVGHLPFTVDPGRPAVEAAARAMCEQSYGDYLGVPYGQSFLPLETPLLPPALAKNAWQARPVIACWLGSVGPWTLKATRTVAALQQKTPWSPAGDCKIELPDALKITAGKPGIRCIAPGPDQRLSVPGGSFAMDLEFAPLGKGAGAAKIGAGCFDGANLDNGYSFEVNPDGTLEIDKHAGGQHTKLAGSAKPKNAGPPATASTPLQLSCKVLPEGVELLVFSTGGRKASFVDKTAPITRLSPRLVLNNVDVPGAVMTTMIFNATRL